MREDLTYFREKEALYSLFASLYLSPPTAEQLKILSNPEAMEVFALLVKDEPQTIALKELTSHINKASIEDIRNEFNSLFVVPNKGSYVPPYESCFREKRGGNIGNLWGETTADVAKFYREAGYETQNPSGVFAPDHIGVEFAFVAKLCSDRLRCLENHDSQKANRIEVLRKSFLEQHLSRWFEDFSNALSISHSSFFYKHLTRLATQLVFSDLKGF